MSEVLGRKAYNIDQPSGFQLTTGGPSLALGGIKTGKDVVSETNLVQVSGGTSTLVPTITDSVSESNIVTVV